MALPTLLASPPGQQRPIAIEQERPPGQALKSNCLVWPPSDAQRLAHRQFHRTQAHGHKLLPLLISRLHRLDSCRSQTARIAGREQG